MKDQKRNRHSDIHPSENRYSSYCRAQHGADWAIGMSDRELEQLDCLYHTLTAEETDVSCLAFVFYIYNSTAAPVPVMPSAAWLKCQDAW